MYIKHKEESFIRFPNMEKMVETLVFGNWMKRSFQCLKWLFKPLIILGEVQSKSLPNFMIVKITFSNLLHGSDVMFSLHELLMNLRIML